MFKYSPHEYQELLDKADTRIVAGFGGRRGGKTIAMVKKVVEWLDRGRSKCCGELCKYQEGKLACPKCGKYLEKSDIKNVELLAVAPTYNDLNDVHVELLKKMIPPHIWQKGWNEQKKTLTIPFNDGFNKLYCRSADNPEKIGRGKFYDLIWLDEIRFYKGLKLMVESLKPTLIDSDGFLYATTTTAGKDESYKVFYENAKYIYKPADQFSEERQSPVRVVNEGGDPDLTLITWRTIDNPHIKKELVMKDRETMTDWYWRQEYFASIEGGIGLVYDMFNTNSHVVKPIMFDRDDPLFVGIDVGWNHPSAVTFIIRSGEGNYYIVDEIYERKKSPGELADLIKQKLKDLKRLCVQGEEFNVNMMVIDPASKQSRIESEGRSVYDQLVEHPNNLQLQLAKNDVMGGINLVVSFLKEEVNKKKKLLVTTDCPNTIAEFGMYQWATDNSGNQKDDVKKINDDLMDAVRYTLYSRPEGFERPERDSDGLKIPMFEEDPYSISYDEGEWVN